MKFSLIIFLMSSLVGFSQKTNEIPIKSPISQVKLFLTAGEMTHQSEVKLAKGRNKLVYSGISAFADPQSIQFFANQTYRLVSVSTEMDFLAAEQYNPKIAVLKDSLEKTKDLLQLNSDIFNSYQAELAVLNTNRDLKGENQNLSIAQIKEAGEYYRTRTLEINKQVSKLNKEKQKLNNQIELIRYQLTELNFNENQRSNQIIVLIDSEVATTTSCTIRYLVSDCGWAASYDLAATDLNQKINLKYKARIYNNTGNDWNNVDLILSTADPLLSASQPILEPWYIDFQALNQAKNKTPQSPLNYKADYRSNVASELSVANQRVYDNYMLDKDEEMLIFGDDFKRLDQKKNQKPAVKLKQIEISELSAEFVITNKFSCPSESKPYSVDVKEMNLDANFSHVSIPKLDQGAFLIANITGWQELDLVPGPTNVYFGGVYVGVSQIDTRNVGDTLALSFGRDTKVTVLRKLKKEVSSKKVMGSTKKETYLYETSIRNNQNVPIKINVFDQIPLSKNTDITISTDEISNGSKDIITGEVKWEITLQPGETKNIEIGYSVKYPKDAQIKIQRFRTISCPSF